MMDSNLITANNLDENPRMQHRANTTNTSKDLEPVEFMTAPPGVALTAAGILKCTGILV